MQTKTTKKTTTMKKKKQKRQRKFVCVWIAKYQRQKQRVRQTAKAAKKREDIREKVDVVVGTYCSVVGGRCLQPGGTLQSGVHYICPPPPPPPTSSPFSYQHACVCCLSSYVFASLLTRWRPLPNSIAPSNQVNSNFARPADPTRRAEDSVGDGRQVCVLWWWPCSCMSRLALDEDNLIDSNYSS